MRMDTRKDRHDEINNRFSKFCKRTQKNETRDREGKQKVESDKERG